jgi:predicted XRE-type DNA-binding protein
MAKAKSIAKTVQGNVFQQIGFSAEESIALKMRAKLHASIVEAIKKSHYTQIQLAEMFDTDQPRVSNLMRGKIASFSLETLVTYADILGMKPKMTTAKRPALMAATAAR